jgi:hypothetical protein
MIAASTQQTSAKLPALAPKAKKPSIARPLRVCWSGGPDPVPGNMILSKNGKVAHLVIRVREMHRALLSPIARLEIEVRSAATAAYPEEYLAAALPWSHTGAPDQNGAKHPSAAPTALANAQARAKAERRAVRRATTLLDAQRKPGLVEPVRLPAERRKKQPEEVDETPVSAGEVDPAQWSEPENTNQFAEHAKVVSGYRSANVLVRMGRRPGSQISQDHIRAVEKVRLAWDIARIGLGAGNPYEASGGSAPGPKTSHGAAAEQQVARAREYARVLKAVGPRRRRMFEFVVIGNRDMVSWVRWASNVVGSNIVVDRKVEMGKLIGILDTLVDHYHSELAFDVAMGNIA